MGERILIVEDEEKIARYIELELLHEGYDVKKAHDGRNGLKMLEYDQFDIALLDIMLPEISGLEILRRIRKHSNIPIILLTARDTIMDKVTGLELGADDYITKPFAIEELLARVRAILRKETRINIKKNDESEIENHEILSSGKLKLDKSSHEVFWEDNLIELTKKEFLLLQTLLENKTIVLSRDALLQTVWGYDYIGETNVVDVYIYYLRNKIDDVYNEKIIETVRGMGYVIK